LLKTPCLLVIIIGNLDRSINRIKWKWKRVKDHHFAHLPKLSWWTNDTEHATVVPQISWTLGCWVYIMPPQERGGPFIEKSL